MDPLPVVIPDDADRTSLLLSLALRMGEKSVALLKMLSSPNVDELLHREPSLDFLHTLLLVVASTPIEEQNVGVKYISHAFGSPPLAESSNDSSKAEYTLRVGSRNMHDFGGEKTEAFRFEALIAEIPEYDVFAIQELAVEFRTYEPFVRMSHPDNANDPVFLSALADPWLKFLHQMCEKNYAWISPETKTTQNTQGAKERSIIFYRVGTVQCIAGGYLSSERSSAKRVASFHHCPYAALFCIDGSGDCERREYFWVVNCHLATGLAWKSSVTRRREMELIRFWADKFAKWPCIIVGDLNLVDNQDDVLIFNEGVHKYDIDNPYHGSSDEYKCPTNSAKDTHKFDFVLCDARLGVIGTSTRLPRLTEKGQALSDHHGISATICLTLGLEEEVFEHGSVFIPWRDEGRSLQQVLCMFPRLAIQALDLGWRPTEAKDLVAVNETADDEVYFKIRLKQLETIISPLV